jgi:hypothetical protein
MRSLWATIVGLPARLLICVVRLYQVTLSPFIGRSCRFQPTCSNYMIGAVQKYGFLRGGWRGVCRLARCQPFCRGGYDPP